MIEQSVKVMVARQAEDFSDAGGGDAMISDDSTATEKDRDDVSQSGDGHSW